MSFLAFSPLLAYALLAGVAALIWLLYLIKPRMPRVEMASTLLWRRVLGEARSQKKDRWRWLLSLLLALAIGLSLTFALTRPELRALGASHQRIVVILDNSASMAARTHDGATRWQHAVESARRVIQRAGAGSEALVLDTAGRAPLTSFVPARQALEQLRRVPLSPEAGGRVPPLPVAAPITGVHLFTDGVGIDSVPRGTVVHSVFEAADNVAITGFEARPIPGDPTRYEAFLQIVNAAPTPKLVALEVVGAGGFRLERQLQVAGASTMNQMLDVSRFDQGILRAQVHSEGDAFDLDDTAYAVVSRAPRSARAARDQRRRFSRRLVARPARSGAERSQTVRDCSAAGLRRVRVRSVRAARGTHCRRASVPSSRSYRGSTRNGGPWAKRRLPTGTSPMRSPPA